MIAARDRLRISARAWAAIVAAGVLLLAAVVATAGSSPAACARCHTAEVKASKASSHSRVSCYRCHLSAGAWSFAGFKAEEMFGMYPAALLGRKQSGPVTPLSASACMGCHTKIMTAEKPLAARGLRILHRACAGDTPTCDGCHSTTAHGKATRNPQGPVMQDCLACHSKRHAPTACTTCHEGKLPTDRIRTGTFAITHGSHWRETHGLGDLNTCEACHTAARCTDCHKTPIPHPADFGATHGSYAKRDSKDCQACHRDPAFCSGCHGLPMPHPAGFTKVHSKVAKSVDDSRCTTCHDQTDCVRCHVRHVHPGGARGVPVPPRIPVQGGGGS